MSRDQTDDKLVRMANQIATFFASQPGGARADGVAAHINKFWEPRMRTRFLELMSQASDRFDPLVVKAAERVKRPASG